MAPDRVIVQADWIVPIAGPPIRGGFVAYQGGRVQAVGAAAPAAAAALGRVAVLPALVNAHTHLELSHLHRRVPPCRAFNDWVLALMDLRRSGGASDEAIGEAARSAIEQSRGFGTGLIGDVGNTLCAVPLLRRAGIAAQVFYELLGFNVADAAGRVARARQAIEAAGVDGDGVRISLAPHAPYSVSPALFRAIRDDVAAHAPRVTSVHLGESTPEVELLARGTGAARQMLERLGVWSEAWRPPGVSPVDYLADLGFLDAATLVVHGVQFGERDLARLRAIGATIVSCPRSNVHVGVGSPPLEAFYRMNLDVAFGTDSLASVDDLNMFAELAEARRIAPELPARALLRSATLTGARALGFEAEFGSIEPGKRAALIAVRVPEGVSDVEEYLVSGIEPGAIVWLE